MDKPVTPLDSLINLEIEAREFGFDWPDRESIIEQALSECEEIKEAIQNNESKERIQEEIGDLIHTAISLCIFAGFDTKETIAKVTDKFGARMQKVKALTKEKGLLSLKGQSTEFMLELWSNAKKVS